MFLRRKFQAQRALTHWSSEQPNKYSTITWRYKKNKHKIKQKIRFWLLFIFFSILLAGGTSGQERCLRGNRGCCPQRNGVLHLFTLARPLRKLCQGSPVLQGELISRSPTALAVPRVIHVQSRKMKSQMPHKHNEFNGSSAQLFFTKESSHENDPWLKVSLRKGFPPKNRPLQKVPWIKESFQKKRFLD